MNTNIFSVNDWLISSEQTDNFNYIIDIHDDNNHKVFHVNTTDVYSVNKLVENLIEFIEGKRQ